MKDRQFKIAIARFPYGGNGGVSSEVPEIGDWLVSTVLAAKGDPRVSEIVSFKISDTPITMTRNRAVMQAREIGADVLIMVDSDMAPDLYLGSPGVPSFWQSTFDFFCDHYSHGPCVVGAPYCGPPPFENVYVFEWKGYETATPNDHFSLDAFTREQAATLGGIQPVAALPTGLIFFDMRIFDILIPPYFSYEYPDKFEATKASTEDVMATRDMHLRGLELLGYNPVYVNWDTWAGHWKPKCVGKPTLLRAGSVAEKYRNSLKTEVGVDEVLLNVGAVQRNISRMKPSENGHATQGKENTGAAAGGIPQAAEEGEIRPAFIGVG